MDRLGWLSQYSESALRSALRVAGGGLGRFLAKFAFSEPTAVRVWHEARVLKLLADLPEFDVPDVAAAGPDPACLVTRIVEGCGAPLLRTRPRIAAYAGCPAPPYDTRRRVVAFRSESALAASAPGGGTPDDYVDELATRFALIGIES